MVAEAKDALICDFAEYYHIYDFESMKPSRAAIYAWGLPDDSRIKRAMNNQPVTTDLLLKAAMVDRLSLLVWSKTQDAEKGKNQPQSIVAQLLKDDKETKQELTSYATISDYEKARQEMIQRIKDKQNG